MVLMSASLTDFAVAGCGMGPKEPAPPLRILASSLACAPLSPLYFVAISSSDGPVDLLVAAWHEPQLFSLNKVSPSLAATATTETDKAAITAGYRIFMGHPLVKRQTELGIFPAQVDMPGACLFPLVYKPINYET